jgi:alkanesulfonate monooxygenase SsuD/methylene tetrahydromethanopterin reductase-like flavin-dependent oxidoreductase (luciferase family)
MKLGIYLNSQHPLSDDPARRFAETAEQVRLVRSLGFDSIWAGEHHITPGFHFFPQFPLLNRIAAEAEGLWIGTNVTLLPLHNPIELAEHSAFHVVTGGGSCSELDWAIGLRSTKCSGCSCPNG